MTSRPLAVFRRLPVATAPVFLLVALTACGGETPDEEPGAATSDMPVKADDLARPTDGESADSDDAGGDGDDGGDICTTLAEVTQHFGVIETGMTDDAEQTAAAVEAARALLESTAPPPELEQAWSDITAFYVAVDEAFAEAEIIPGERSFAVLGDAALDIPDTVAPAVEGSRVVESHATENCTGTATPAASGAGAAETAVSELCALFTDDDLARVFEDDPPEMEDGSWGPEAQECIWEAPDGTAVSVMLLTRDDFDAQFLQKSGEPRAVVEGLENGEVHTGTFGIGWFDTRGSSVYFTAGDWGGTANVRTGEHGDASNDDPIAIEFATMVAAAVS